MLIFIIRKNNLIKANTSTYIEFLRSIIGAFCFFENRTIRNKSPPTNRLIF